MYYSSNKTNSDYYNTYKEEMATLEDYHEGFSFQKIIKIGFTILLLGLFSIFTIYLMNNLSIDSKERVVSRVSTIDNREKIPAKISFSEEVLPKSIQIEREKIDISPKDVAVIVEIIMNQINNRKKVSLEHQLISAEDCRVNMKTLKSNNHYNKIVISNSNNKNIIDRDKKFKKDLDALLREASSISSGYEEAIKKEINTRANEMRVIIVQKGDTLSKIAKKAYGNFDAYIKILMANPEVLKNPNEIFVGQKLRIPA